MYIIMNYVYYFCKHTCEKFCLCCHGRHSVCIYKVNVSTVEYTKWIDWRKRVRNKKCICKWNMHPTYERTDIFVTVCLVGEALKAFSISTISNCYFLTSKETWLGYGPALVTDMFLCMNRHWRYQIQKKIKTYLGSE